MNAISNFRRRLRRLDGGDYFIAGFCALSALAAVFMFVFSLFYFTEIYSLFWGILAELFFASFIAGGFWVVGTTFFRD
jgi:hypothetical protein